MVSLFTFIIDILTLDETFCCATEVICGEVPVEKDVGVGESVSVVVYKSGCGIDVPIESLFGPK